MRRRWSKSDTLYEHVMRNVTPEPNTGCHLFTGSGVAGYGRLMHHGVVWLAHRAAWTVVVGPIPEGLEVLHHCDMPACVLADPDPLKSHLFLGTPADNVADMRLKGRARFDPAPLRARHEMNRTKTHCTRGHLLTGQNLVPQALLIGERVCRRCNAIRLAKYRARRREVKSNAAV